MDLYPTHENYNLKISIKDVSVEIYRCISVPSSYTGAELYRIILKIFYWSGEKQHRFLIKKKVHKNIDTSELYGLSVEALMLDGYDMLAEDYFCSLNIDHFIAVAFDTEITLHDIFHKELEDVQDQGKELYCSYGSECVRFPSNYLHRIELVNVTISKEKLTPTLLESSGIRPPEVLYGSMEYLKNHKFVCDESYISYHEGIDSYAEITEPRRSLDELNELLKTEESSLGINDSGLIHNNNYPFMDQRCIDYWADWLFEE